MPPSQTHFRLCTWTGEPFRVCSDTNSRLWPTCRRFAIAEVLPQFSGFWMLNSRQRCFLIVYSLKLLDMLSGREAAVCFRKSGDCTWLLAARWEWPGCCLHLGLHPQDHPGALSLSVLRNHQAQNTHISEESGPALCASASSGCPFLLFVLLLILLFLFLPVLGIELRVLA